MGVDTKDLRPEVICVHLYGDGRRNCRLRAEYIWCDRASECSAYKNGKCFCVTTLFGVRCKNGTVNCVDGGTKQSKAFLRVRNEAKAHEKYAALKYPDHTYVTKIGNDVFLTMPYIWLEICGDSDIYCHDPHIGTNRLYVDAEMLSPKNIKRICDFRPHSIMGGEIWDYQRKVVPQFLCELKTLFPNKYSDFEAEYPDYEIKQPDWCGRRARLATCNKECEYKDNNGNIFRFDGNDIVCDCYKSVFTPFGGKYVKMQISVTDELEVVITDNAQVTENTVLL